ncbi:MAG: FAD-dependent oxidoreductase [Thermoplasmata archaeon]|nr:FAD-dependent oxidoreductase [Thermoplasmata archaeon]
MKTNDVAVIGAGPAGIAASIYLKRDGLEPLLFEHGEVGGLLMNANLVENYPGFPGGISGPELVDIFRSQLERTGVKVSKTAVTKIVPENNAFRISTKDDEFLASSVIFATGTAPKDVILDGMNGLLGERIFYEVKDVPQPRKGKRFVVLGSGDAAFDYALSLSRDDCHVDIVMRAESPKCLPLLEQRVGETPSINIITSTSPESVRLEGDSLVLECESDGNARRISSDHLLLACGRRPNVGALPTELSGRIEAGDLTDTGLPGLFLAGDVKRGDFRPVGIAVGDGILAAMSASAYLKNSGGRL